MMTTAKMILLAIALLASQQCLVSATLTIARYEYFSDAACTTDTTANVYEKDVCYTSAGSVGIKQNCTTLGQFASGDTCLLNQTHAFFVASGGENVCGPAALGGFGKAYCEDIVAANAVQLKYYANTDCSGPLLQNFVIKEDECLNGFKLVRNGTEWATQGYEFNNCTGALFYSPSTSYDTCAPYGPNSRKIFKLTGSSSSGREMATASVVTLCFMVMIQAFTLFAY